MNSLVTIDKNDEPESCSGCRKILSLNLFIDNNKNFRTCDMCRAQNKLYKQKANNKQSSNPLVEIHDLKGSLKEQANQIVEIISDVGEYKW
ncbi:13849_t:CDS:2, partial [Dentiscutata erythropus]